MSRVGRMPVAIPAGVTVEVGDGRVRVKGPKGDLSTHVIAGTAVPPNMLNSLLTLTFGIFGTSAGW